MKAFLFLILLFLFNPFISQDEPKFVVKGSQKTKDMGYVSKRKALDCNKDLEWSPGTTIVFHKKSGKPYTGTCVAYYDNRKLERKTNFILGKENGECFTYYKNGKVKVKSIYVEGIENGTWGYWYENGQVAWGNTYDMGDREGEWLYFHENGKSSKSCLLYTSDAADE